MTSSHPSPVIILDDNDDEFDWEAAVREIDSACEKGAKPPEKALGGLRQSTLERFVERRPDVGREKDVAGTSGRFEGFGDGGCGRVEVDIDLEAAKTWVYPSNVPCRSYQYSIAEKALYSNTLVVLPTGLGKTLIGAVVMYNYFRWFPEGKIVFTAPSRPLVAQQIKACHNVVGIPQESAIDMTGQISPQKRSEFWNVKRVFFVTPQILEKDIHSGICLVKKLVCLVVDEAHRASGNFAYCVAVRKLMSVPVQLRILALTATPGSQKNVVQNVIDNLFISTLEYRDEDHEDVSSYVHNRVTDLITVPMGKDANAIDHLLIDVMNPYSNALRRQGHANRDLTTSSPCELLKLKEKFLLHSANTLSSAEKDKIVSDFGILLTLTHVRKLLSGYGIRPAYEMLEEKLKGSIARIKRNELICKVLDLMTSNLSHGAPNPKLLKMIEILSDHFKTKGPEGSRVIIFSNFRESVKDILNSLTQIKDLVKATEFIGQSSGQSSRGKPLKGQSQKVQQAVLQKFRSGEYNVIVATSIGEEGLDIIEVDLVICFDANISSLRMTQRMGRTGRKNDGRVVVLACEGVEYNGYKKKEAKAKGIRKFLTGNTSQRFNFHPSPRMLPHSCKPEVKFIEFVIDEFVDHRKKAKDISSRGSPLSIKLSNKEEDLISRYFNHCNKKSWKPSLIAFPHFQALPSITYQVRHSLRTKEMFIKTVQNIQGPAPSTKKTISRVEDKDPATQRPSEFGAKGEQNLHFGTSYSAEVPIGDPNEVVYNRIPEFSCRKPLHSFLFGANFVNVSTDGKVIITSVPVLLMKEYSDASRPPSNFTNSSVGKKMKDGFHEVPSECVPKVPDASVSECTDHEGMLPWQFHNYDQEHEEKLDGNDIIFQTPISRHKLVCEDTFTEMPDEKINSTLRASKSVESLNDMDISPRLTGFIEKGFVPESPITGHVISLSKAESPLSLTCNHSQEKCSAIPSPLAGAHNDIHLVQERCSKDLVDPQRDDYADNVNMPKSDYLCGGPSNQIDHSGSPVNNIYNQVSSQMNDSTISDWQLNSEEIVKSVESPPRYKRLRKYGDKVKRDGHSIVEENTRESRTHPRPQEHKNPGFQKRGVNKEMLLAKTFIDEEAEESSDAELLEVEEDEDTDDYDSSFIDDKTVSTEANIEASSSGDMMGFYRRSLLTQSPLETPLSNFASFSHGSSSRTGTNCQGSSKEIDISSQTPMHDLNATDHGSISPIHQVLSERVSLLSSASENCGKDEDCSIPARRKRKLSFQTLATGNKMEMIPEDSVETASVIKNPTPVSVEDSHLKSDLVFDDDFYKNIDLDALEAEAAETLRSKPGLLVLKEIDVQSGDSDNHRKVPPRTSISIPSFDLGI